MTKRVVWVSVGMCLVFGLGLLSGLFLSGAILKRRLIRYSRLSIQEQRNKGLMRLFHRQLRLTREQRKKVAPIVSSYIEKQLPHLLVFREASKAPLAVMVKELTPLLRPKQRKKLKRLQAIYLRRTKALLPYRQKKQR